MSAENADTRYRYYRLEERNPAEISIAWKVFHAIIFVVTAFSSYASIYSFSMMMKVFGDQCLLYSSIVFIDKGNEFNKFIVTEVTATPNITSSTTPMTVAVTTVQPALNESGNSTLELEGRLFNENETDIGSFGLIIDFVDSTWGRHYLCNVCEFCLLLSLMVSIFCLVFVLLTARGGAGQPGDLMPKPWIMVVPLAFVSATILLIMILTAFKISDGLHTFCNEDLYYNGTKSCIEMMDQYAMEHKHYYFSPWFYLCSMFVHIVYLCWLAQLILLIMRVICVTDFSLYFYNLRPIESRKKVEDDQAH